MKLDKILVPLDGSMLAETALPAACANTIEAQVLAVQEAEEYLARGEHAPVEMPPGATNAERTTHV